VYLEMNINLIFKPFTGNVYVSIWVKIFRRDINQSINFSINVLLWFSGEKKQVDHTYNVEFVLFQRLWYENNGVVWITMTP
jgi:hypothetical protein